MKIKVKVLIENDHATVSKLTIDGKFYGYVLEDENRAVKIKGETRIPSGTYKIGLRTVGKHHEQYLKDYPSIHIGMLELQNVPNFQFILIHKGNFETDTSGCLLCGKEWMGSAGVLSVTKSKLAYDEIYPIISSAIKHKEDVTIEIDRTYD